MEELLLCIHTIRESSLDDLREAVLAKEIGVLNYATIILGPTFEETQDILQQNQWKFLSKYGAGLPVLDLHPFAEKVNVDGDTEYYAFIPDVYKLDEANQLWSSGIITSARLSFNEWLVSSDALREHPSNRECDMLRRCANQAKLFHVADEPDLERKELPSQPKKTGSKLYQKRADRELACDTAARMIIAGALAHEETPTQVSLAERITGQGIWKQESGTLENYFSKHRVIGMLIKKAKGRPENTESKAYKEWRKNMEDRADMLREAIIRRHDEGFPKGDRIRRTDVDTGEVLPNPTKRKARKNKKKENGEKDRPHEK